MLFRSEKGMLMNTEKTVRKQAKKVLEGNRSVIISEIMVAVLAFFYRTRSFPSDSVPSEKQRSGTCSFN